MLIKTAEKIFMFCGGLLAFLGFAGMAGYVETGNGLFISLVVEAIGLYLCLWSYRFGNIRHREEEKILK